MQKSRAVCHLGLSQLVLEAIIGLVPSDRRADLLMLGDFLFFLDLAMMQQRYKLEFIVMCKWF